MRQMGGRVNTWEEELGEGETVIRIYCIKKIFSMKKEEEILW